MRKDCICTYSCNGVLKFDVAVYLRPGHNLEFRWLNLLGKVATASNRDQVPSLKVEQY